MGDHHAAFPSVLGNSATRDVHPELPSHPAPKTAAEVQLVFGDGPNRWNWRSIEIAFHFATPQFQNSFDSMRFARDKQNVRRFHIRPKLGEMGRVVAQFLIRYSVQACSLHVWYSTC